MAIFYRFGSEKQFKCVPVESAFISVRSLKEKLCDVAKHLIRCKGRFRDDLFVADAQTGQEFLDEATLIPRNASILISRLPSRPTVPIVVETAQGPNPVEKEAEIDSSSSLKICTHQSESEWEDFGPEIYSTPITLPVKASNEDGKIRAFVETPALGYGKKTLTPPPGYVCHRCNVAGHFIKDCPTNGDPNYQFKRVRPPTGIPKSMLMATPDGSCALSNGSTAWLKAHEAAFDKEVEGLPSKRCPVADDLIPPELHCPLCKQVIKDAVFAKKCCFKSFCYTCIRDHYLASKFVCVCGARGVLVDDLLPNITLRDTIARILESSSSSSSGNAVTSSRPQVPDTVSVQCPQPKKEPAHAAAEQQQQVQQQVQQQKKKRPASNGMPTNDLQRKKPHREHNFTAGDQCMNMMPQVPFAYNQHWLGNPYINSMSYGMAAAPGYQGY